MQPAISVEQHSVSFFRHRDAQLTLLRSGVARRVGVVRFALRFALRVAEQPGADLVGVGERALATCIGCRA